jgi:hypothetical protein
VNQELNRILGVEPGSRGKMRTEDFVLAAKSLDEVLNKLTRRLKARQEEI